MRSTLSIPNGGDLVLRVHCFTFARQGQGRAYPAAPSRLPYLLWSILAAILAVVAVYGFTNKLAVPALLGTAGAMFTGIKGMIAYDKWDRQFGPYFG